MLPLSARSLRLMRAVVLAGGSSRAQTLGAPNPSCAIAAASAAAARPPTLTPTTPTTRALATTTTPSTGGLFGIPHLRRPEDLLSWADASIAECRALASRIASAATNPRDGRLVVGLMDSLSDRACQAYDLSECARHVHGSAEWRAAAGAACARLGAYVAAVNHDEGVADKLAAAMRGYELGARAMAAGGGGGGGGGGGAPDGGDGAGATRADAPMIMVMTPQEVRAFSGEAALVGARLAEDFERSGLRLRDPKARRRMEALLGEGAHWPSAFAANLSDRAALGAAALDARAVAGLPPEWRDELLARRPELLPLMTNKGRSAAASAAAALSSRQQQLLLPLDGGSLARFLASVPDERAREAAWRAGQASPQANASVAAAMLRGRAEMAALLGSPSYAALKTSGGGALAGTPAAVAAFLASAADQVAPLADAEAARLLRAKRRHVGDPSARLNAWDVDFYSSRGDGGDGVGGGGRSAALAAAAAAAAAPYLRLPFVLEGLGELVLRVFGVRMRLEPLGPGEAWAPGVVRVGLINEDDGGGGGGGDGGGEDGASLSSSSSTSFSFSPPWRSPAPPAPGERLATLYLDLCPRPGKTPGSVLFPVRCGRVLPGVGGGGAVEGGGGYQTPIMVLVMSIGGSGGGGGGDEVSSDAGSDDAWSAASLFRGWGGEGGGGGSGSGSGSGNSNSGAPPGAPDLALSWRELRTLVHEAGHALHNACSRTRYQHLWGTRCAQDVVEVPSHLFEHFVLDARSAAVLCRRLGRGRGRGDGGADADALPPALHARLCRTLDGSFPALELQHQALLALADQACHGGGPPGYGLDWRSLSGGGGGGSGGGSDQAAAAAAAVDAAVSRAWGDLSARYAPSVPFVPGSRPHLRFAHLATYGAAYYAYPYAKCVAEALWHEFFAKGPGGGGGGGPLDPAAGRALRRRLLEPGGAREPRELLGSLLGARAGREVDGGFAPDPADWVRGVVVAGKEEEGG